ncbi:hypothetical protein CF326_g2647 [Tilletia indica]|nr:hypothetical protein CF326_g2647 [Tilletia indica]
MLSFAQELKLFDITGQWFCQDLETEDMGEALSALSLFPQAIASWKAFLEYNGEFIDKKEPGEYDFSRRPRIDDPSVEAAFKKFEDNPVPDNFVKVLKDLKKKGQPSSLNPGSAVNAGPSSSLGVPASIHIPATKGSVSPTRTSLRPRRQNQKYSNTTFDLQDDDEPRGRRRKKTSPSPSPSHTLALSSDSDDGNDKEFTNVDSEEGSLPSSPTSKKRKKSRGQSSTGSAPKRLRSTRKEQEPSASTKASPAVQSDLQGTGRRESKQHSKDTRTEGDGDRVDNDRIMQDECARKGSGGEDTRKARDAAKARQQGVSKGKNGRVQDWRYLALNDIQSIPVLKYFDPESKVEPSHGFIKSITWKCRCCHRSFTAAPGITTNLMGHLNAKPGRGPCLHRDNPLSPGVEPWIPAWQKKGPQDDIEPERDDGASQSPLTRKGTKEERRSALEAQTVNQRRATLVWIVMTGQSFTAAQNPHFRRMMATANTAVNEAALESARTIGPDLDKMHSSLFSQAIEAIKTANTKFSIQLDGWTTRNRRVAYLAVHANWIDASFARREACIAFDQLGTQHTGATFAAHIVTILRTNGLWDHWSGILVSDADQGNISASRLVQREVESEVECVVPMSSKVSDSLILCFAHGLNRVVLDGTAAVGARMAMVDKDADKVLRPAIVLDGNEVEGGVQRYDELIAQQEITAEEKDAEQQIRKEMTELMEDPILDGDEASWDGEDVDVSGSPGGLSADDVEILQEYEASVVDESSPALTRIHQCLVKIRASPESFTHFGDLVKSCYPGDRKKDIPMLRNTTRWNSALIEMRGCVEVQRAFTALMDSDNGWKPYAVTRAEWLAMEKLVDVMECAEVLNLDARSRESSIGDILFFHHVLRTNLQLQLDALQGVQEGEAAFGLKKAIIAMQRKHSQHLRRAKKSDLLIVATLLHPGYRLQWLERHFPAQFDNADNLLREYLDIFTGRGSRAEANTVHTKYDRFIGAQGRAAPSLSSQDDEVDKYLSKLYSWDSRDVNTLDGVIAWWDRHAVLLPRLSILARVVLAVPASTAATEQSFRHGAIFCSPRRNLGPRSIRTLTMSKALLLSGFDGFADTDVTGELPHSTPKKVISSSALATPTSEDEARQTL